MKIRRSTAKHLSYFFEKESKFFGSIGFFSFKSLGIWYQNQLSFHSINLDLGVIRINLTIIKSFNKKINV